MDRFYGPLSVCINWVSLYHPQTWQVYTFWGTLCMPTSWCQHLKQNEVEMSIQAPYKLKKPLQIRGEIVIYMQVNNAVSLYNFYNW